jgi:translation initiation factor 6
LPLSRISLYGNANVGAFIFATDRCALIPNDAPPSVEREVSEALGVPVLKAAVAGSVLLGIFIIGNSKGIILPGTSSDEEISAISGATGLPVALYYGKKNALGNMVLVNNNAALVGPETDPSLIELVSKHLKVEVKTGTIAEIVMTGVCAVVNGKGLVAHPMTTDAEVKELAELFNIPVDISTVNCGFPYVRVGIAANSNGAVVGSATTGPEMARIESSLGITGG